MWYWLVRFEGMLLTPFIPLYMAYYARRGIPITLRCTKCRRWLLLDPRRFRLGLCETCFREVIESDNIGFEKLHQTYEGIEAPPSSVPAFDPTFKGIAEGVGYGRVLEVGCGPGYLLSRLNS